MVRLAPRLKKLHFRDAESSFDRLLEESNSHPYLRPKINLNTEMAQKQVLSRRAVPLRVFTALSLPILFLYTALYSNRSQYITPLASIRSRTLSKPRVLSRNTRILADEDIDKDGTRIEIPPHLEFNLADIEEPYNHGTTKETPLYWHVLKSGGTTVKDWYAECFGLVIACEVGALKGHDQDKTLEIVEVNEGMRHVNVDTTVLPGILRASSLNLVPSRISDIIFSPLLHESTTHLYSEQYKGRMFAMFRDPIDRVVSLFYYLQAATWEPTYNPELADMTLEEYANSTLVEANWMVRALVNKFEGPLSWDDMNMAKEILRRKCIVGLMNEWELSTDRFNRYFGFAVQPKTFVDKLTHFFKFEDESFPISDHDEQSIDKSLIVEEHNIWSEECKERYKNNGGSNVHRHPKLERNSIAYEILARKNAWDINLYEYILQLFEEQAALVENTPQEPVESAPQEPVESAPQEPVESTPHDTVGNEIVNEAYGYLDHKSKY